MPPADGGAVPTPPQVDSSVEAGRFATTDRGRVVVPDTDDRAGSRDFAELVQRNLVGGIREVHPYARDLDVKQERFEVLIGALMPSVLTEVSFLTNQEEATLLATNVYLDRISDALFLSILEYQSRSTSSVDVAADNFPPADPLFHGVICSFSSGSLH